MKTHVKRSLSLFLSLVMIITSLSVAFQAFADDIQDARDEKITNVEAQIKDFYDKDKNNLNSTKTDEDSLANKAAAREHYNAINTALSPLSSSEKLQLNVAYYAYWFQVVSNDILYGELGKSATSDQKIEFTVSRVADFEKLCGAFPDEYSQAIKAVAPLAEKNGTAFIFTSKTNFKNNTAAQTALDTLFDDFVKLSASQIKFLDHFVYWSSYNGGYYCAQTNLSEKSATTLNTILNLLYLDIQDVDADGADPKNFSASTYVTRSNTKPYTYDWKTGQSAQTYIDAFDKYQKDYDKNVTAVSNKVVNKVITATDNMKGFEDLSKAVKTIIEVATKVYNNEAVTKDELENAVALQANLSENSLRFYNTMASSAYCKVVATSSNVYTDASALTPELAYTKPSKINTYNLNYCLIQIKSKINDIDLQDFVDYIDKIDLSNVTESTVNEVKSKYAALVDANKKKLSADTIAKIMQIVMPEPDHNDFSQEIKDYKITDIVRPANSDIAWTEGGIQSSADGLWRLIGNVAGMIAPEAKVKETGLDTILKTNVYTNKMIANVISLYASLSRDKTDLGIAKLTLGGLISSICSPENIVNDLEEAKYSKAVTKINESLNGFKETEEENKLEHIAKIDFVNGDFGFEDGDRAGFVDALLAIIRPITNLLAPGASIMGFVSINVKMFDHITSDGNYENGVYANLIPALEAMGLTSIPTAKEYEENYYNVVAKSGKNIASDEFLRPILNAVCTQYIDVVSPDAVNGLIKILPGIAYTIGSNLLNDSVKSALSQAGLLSSLASSLDLSGDSINKMITAQPIYINGNPIQLQAIDWLKLGNCATVSSVKSKSNGNDYLMLRTGDTDTCFTTVYYYVYDVFFADENNLESLQKIINTSITNVLAAATVNRIINNIAYLEKEDSYAKFLYVVGGKPTGAEIPGRPTQPSKPTTEPTTEPTKPSEPATEPTQPSEPSTQPTAPVTQSSAPATTKSNKTKLPKNYKKVGKDIVNTKQKKASFKKVKAQRKAIAFEWKKVSGIKGYQIQYTTDKKFKKGVKSTTITKQKTTKKTVKKLKGKKKYYVRIRTYKTQKINGKTVKVYSNWSKTKSVKTK